MKREDLAAELDDLAALGDVDGLMALAEAMPDSYARAAVCARRAAVRARLQGTVDLALWFERDSERYLAQVLS